LQEKNIQITITVKYESRIMRMDQIFILIASIEIGSHRSNNTSKNLSKPSEKNVFKETETQGHHRAELPDSYDLCYML
jgi:hypothetical protein